MRRRGFHITPQGKVLIAVTVIAIPLAVITNSIALYGVAIALVLVWTVIALRSTSPLFRQYTLGEDPADEAEQRWKLD